MSINAFQDDVERAEEAYEFMISYAGQGIGRDAQREEDTEQIRSYVQQLRDALRDGVEAAARIPDDHDVLGQEHYEAFVDRLHDEVDRAVVVLELLAAQDRITSAQVDDINGMSVFQSVIMKFFFLDDLTEHHAYE